MTERWEPVVGYEGLYEVSDLGRVRSVDRITTHGHRRKGKMLRLQRNHDGYRRAELHRGGVRYRPAVQRLVLEAFIGPCPFGMEACHFPDRDRANNCLSNLRWDTSAANKADRIVHGTSNRGERNGKSKLNATDIDRISDMRRAGCSRKDVAALFKINVSHVSQITNGRAWVHQTKKNRPSVETDPAGSSYYSSVSG